MKKYIRVMLVIILLAMGGSLLIQKSRIAKYKNLYKKELQNVEAYRATHSELKDKLYEYHMTIDDLRNSRDSVDQKIAEVIDELKIKDKKIEYLQHHTGIATKTDTIFNSDTIFVPNVHIDTIIGDKWYTMRLQLEYPSSVVTTPEFRSEKYVIISKKKEYNKKPSKLFFVRWFQKKHEVVEVNVEERSPYIISSENKFIKIIK